jgi:DNA-directed RNA polymerase specialized sigma24 family protein
VSTTDAHTLEEFCSRWRKPVFAFGRMFLGDGAAAEELTCDVLLAVYQQRGSRLSDRELLPRTLGSALRATQKYQPGSSGFLRTTPRLETALQGLPRLERAVVIMRDLLHMDWESTALATDLSRVQAHEAWARGIYQLNELLQRDLTKEGR